MVTRKENQKEEAPSYVVMNPRGLPEGVPIITIDGEDGKSRHFFEGDTYEGPRPEEFREEGVLVTPKQAEQIVETLEREAEEIAGTEEAMDGLPGEGTQLGPEGVPPALRAAEEGS